MFKYDCEEVACNPTVLFHRMGLFVAQVIESTNQRADARIRAARSIVDDLEKMSEAARFVLDHCPDPGGLSGPKAAKELRMQRRIVGCLGDFQRRLNRFVAEHKPLFPPVVLTDLAEYIAWCPKRVAALEERVREFNAQVGKDMVDERGRLQQLNADWDVTTGDGATA